MQSDIHSPSKKHQRSTIASYLHPALVVPYCLSVALGLYWPVEGVNLGPLNSIVDWMMRNIPSIQAYVGKSQFPEVSKAYFTLTFFVFLPTLWLVLKDKDMVMNRKLGFEGQWIAIKKDKIPALRVIFILFFLFIILVVLFVQPGYDFGLMPLNESRIALAFLGGLTSWFSVFFMIGALKNYFHYLIKIVQGV